MIYILHVFYGLIMAYFGLISPGMLNMTVLKIRLHVGKTESIKFAFGAALIIFIQSGIALFFAEFFVENPKVIEILKTVGVFVFFILAAFFFYLSRKKVEGNNIIKKGNFFVKGLAISSVNMLAIPFYLGISIFLAAQNKIIIEQPYISLFSFGASIGAFSLFYTYIFFAKIISQKISFIATNINIILSLLFLSLGIFTIVKLIS